MSQAADLLRTSADADTASRTAEQLTDLVEDEHHAVLYTFDDESVLVVTGLQMAAYPDIAAARAALDA
jgi:hypothetical protein